MRAILVIVAAGSGARAGPGLAKQHRPIAGRSALERSLASGAAHPRLEGVLAAIRAGDEALYERAASALPAAARARLRPPVIGGAERQETVRRALEALEADPPESVLVHDCARPFTPASVIDRVLDALEAGRTAVCPALPVVDTLRRDTGGEAGALVDRTGLVRAQTPQGFRFEALLAAHRAHAATPVTDDAELARLSGLSVSLVAGDDAAFKLTTPEDFARAEALARSRTMEETRVGQGFDVHAFGPNADGSRDHVMLCGMAVPHEDGLLGHSDADVALHALTDAVLGAQADGDIGRHFPPSDPAWRGASSDRFLAHAVERLRAKGGRILQLDVTIICERPKIGPHAEAMRARVAAICGVGLGRVSVKATTTERLGFTGRREGIAALASATIGLPGGADE